MADSNRRIRQYVGLAIIIVAYVGGLIGWSWAALTVEPQPTSPDTTEVVSDSVRAEAPRSVTNADTVARELSLRSSPLSVSGRHDSNLNNMYLRITILLLIGAGSMVGASPAQAQPRATTEAVSDSPRHSTFSRLLSRVVGKEGNVDYATLTRQADTTLAPYLQRIAKTDPSTLSRDARLAFWINAYNALTLKLVTEHYPVKNIWAITPGPAAPKDKNSPFKLEVGVVADTARTLDEIEHQIIRRRFDEPRIHFALVCAAVSCPPLRRDAYTGPRLNKQLDNQAHTFLHDNDKNRIPDGEDQIALSRILKWYGSDFGATTNALQRALAPYFDGPVHDRLSQADYEVTFLSYDWSLNRQVAGTTSTTQDAH